MADSASHGGSPIKTAILSCGILAASQWVLGSAAHHVTPEHIAGVLGVVAAAGGKFFEAAEHLVGHVVAHPIIHAVFAADTGKPTASGLNHDIERALARAAARSITILIGEWRSLHRDVRGHGAEDWELDDLSAACSAFLGEKGHALPPATVAEWLDAVSAAKFLEKPELGGAPWNDLPTGPAPAPPCTFAVWFHWRYPAVFQLQFSEELVADDSARRKFAMVISARILDFTASHAAELGAIRAQLDALAGQMQRDDKEWIETCAGRVLADLRHALPEFAAIIVAALDQKFAVSIARIADTGARIEAGVGTANQTLGFHTDILVSVDQRLGNIESQLPPALATPLGAAPPNEIPAFTDRRVGRDDELQNLVGWLTAEASAMTLCFVVGMGGVGKTFLAADVARQLVAKGSYPDGVIWHEHDGQSPAQVMTHVVSALGANADSLEGPALTAEYRRLLRDRRVLIIVDDAGAANQVAALLTDSRGSAVLVTARQHMPSLKSRATGLIDLKSMTPDDALELLQSKSGPLPAEQRPALCHVALLCGHLPLALSIAGALLGEHEMWPSVQSLEKRLEARRLDCLAIDGCPDLDVRAVLLVSYESMDAALAQVFRSLSVLGRSSFGASAVSRVLGHNKDATITDLARLIGRSVLERSSYGRYVLHDLLRDLAGELVASDESPELAAALRQRAENYWETWRKASRLGALAAGFVRRSEPDKAIECFQKAQALNEEIGDRQGQASAYGGMAAAWARKGEPDRAIECFQKAQALNEEIGAQQGDRGSTGSGVGTWWPCVRMGEEGQPGQSHRVQ